MNERDEELRARAGKLVKNRWGLIIHTLCWAVISVLICIVVPEKAMGVRIGVLVLGFWGICVAIHAVCAFFVRRRLTGKKTSNPYAAAVQREYEKLKTKQENEKMQ